MLEEMHIQLSTSCLLNVPFQTYDSEFTFVVNGQEFRTSRIISELLSPVICKIHKIDPTLDRFTINTKHQGNFSLILQLFNFEKVTLSKSEFVFVCEVLKILENESINLTKMAEKNDLTLENVISYLKNHELLEFAYSEEIEKEIDFISMHFYEFSEYQKEELSQLNELTIHRIIQNSLLKLKDEDEILNFINFLYNQNKNFENLYENVIFANVSSSSMCEFLDLVHFNDISFGTWLSLSQRLKEEVKQKQNSSNRYTKSSSNEIKINNENVKTFIYNEGHEFHGIFDYLTNKNGGNLHDKGIVKVTTNSLFPNFPPKNLIDSSTENSCFYHAKDHNKNIWICFDFNNMKIEISNYSMKTAHYVKDEGNFKNWVLETSNDGNQWTIIDEHSNYSELNDKNKTKTFEVKQNNFSRFVRLRHNGDYWGDNDFCLHLKCVEFYGRLKEK